MKSEHDMISERLARKFKASYLREGVDLKTKDKAIEVATSNSDLYQSIGQLRRSRKAKKYMVVPSSLAQKAKMMLKGSGIGIMDTKGRIRKKARRR